jgi:hypothetical protein
VIRLAVAVPILEDADEAAARHDELTVRREASAYRSGATAPSAISAIRSPGASFNPSASGEAGRIGPAGKRGDGAAGAARVGVDAAASALASSAAGRAACMGACSTAEVAAATDFGALAAASSPARGPRPPTFVPYRADSASPSRRWRSPPPAGGAHQSRPRGPPPRFRARCAAGTAAPSYPMTWDACSTGRDGANAATGRSTRRSRTSQPTQAPQHDPRTGCCGRDPRPSTIDPQEYAP